MADLYRTDRHDFRVFRGNYLAEAERAFDEGYMPLQVRDLAKLVHGAGAERDLSEWVRGFHSVDTGNILALSPNKDLAKITSLTPKIISRFKRCSMGESFGKKDPGTLSISDRIYEDIKSEEIPIDDSTTSGYLVGGDTVMRNQLFRALIGKDVLSREFIKFFEERHDNLSSGYTHSASPSPFNIGRIVRHPKITHNIYKVYIGLCDGHFNIEFDEDMSSDATIIGTRNGAKI